MRFQHSLRASAAFCFLFCLAASAFSGSVAAQDSPLVYQGTEGPGVGKHIVFLAGDHEYRGEQTLPMLARILAKNHGFKCTVLFSIDKDSGEIVPGSSYMPGTEALNDADLAVFFLRFQNFPESQMQPIVDYLDRAGPVVGLRTSTHAFQIPAKSKFAKYDHKYGGNEYEKGFGRQVLGETWVSHYGRNHVMSTRLDIVEAQKDHPILTGVTEPWTESGGYWTDPMPGSTVLAMTQPLETMKKDSKPAADKKPCPNSWTREYEGKDGAKGRVFTSTSGASEDIRDDGFRRMVLNACFWAAGMEKDIRPDMDIAMIGDYNPSTFQMNANYYVGVKPQDMAGWDTPIMKKGTPLKVRAPKKKIDKKAKPKKPQEKKKSEEPVSFVFDPAATVKAAAGPPEGSALSVDLGEHICLIGNGTGERLQHNNHWESMLHQLYSDKELSVRNLCFPGDTVDVRLRSLNFGTPDQHLAHSGASAILFFFGSNESFDGEKGLDSFAEKLDTLIKDTKVRKYNESDTGPKIVLVSPTAFENTGDTNLPDGTEVNKRLKMYTAKMKRIAQNNKVGFADVFAPTKELFDNNAARLTLDGMQLNKDGHVAFAPILNKALFGSMKDVAANAKLKSEVDDKNFHWWHRYRAVNGFSIYGTRGKAGSDGTYNNEDVMERERTILDQMTANRDRRIWSLARGDSVPEKANDDNTLPFINPKTNVGGADDPNRKRGKLGSLDYSPAREQQKNFKMADGYEINLFATEEDFPELANPVALNFDNKGRMWVSTMPSYPHWKPKTKLEDKLLILTDTDGDGQANSCKVFADGLYVPTGFELGHGGVYVAQQPDILFMKDTDGDDVADESTRVITGLGTADSHHGISAFEWGPDGGLYFNEGTFKYSQVESPHGLTRCNEAGVWRFHPRSRDTSVHANYAFANPWGHVFDKWGQNFIADASGGQNYQAALISGKTVYPQKHPGGSHYYRTLNLSKKLNLKDAPKLLKKRIRPTSGCEIVSSRNFPPEAQGNFLLNNVIGERTVLNHKMEEKGTGIFATEVPAILNCDDGNFRPVDIQFGPDGALYIVDWHNALIGHLQHNLREPNRDHSHGRIWRITYKGRPLVTPPKIDGATIKELLEHLKLPEDRTRYRVRRELAARETDKIIPAVKSWLEGLDKDHADYELHVLEGLWLYQTHNVVNATLLEKVLSSKTHQARAAAVRVLSYWHKDIPNATKLLKARISDDAGLVRLEAVRAASFFPPGEVAEAVLDVLNLETDEFIEYQLDETMKVLEEE